MCDMVKVGLSVRVSCNWQLVEIHGNLSLQSLLLMQCSNYCEAQAAPTECEEWTEWARHLCRESITRSVSCIFWGSKHLTFVLGHVLKMSQLTGSETSGKTKVDFHPTKVHFRQLHQKYPTRHITDFFITLLQWNEIVPEMMKWCFTTL